MVLRYGKLQIIAAERGKIKEKREKFKSFKEVYDKLFTKEKLNKWESKVKSEVNKVKKMSPQQVAKLIRSQSDMDLSKGVSAHEYRDIVKNYIVRKSRDLFESVFGFTYETLHEMISSKAEEVSDLFSDRQYGSKIRDMLNQIEYKADPEKLVETYRRSGVDGMYDFTKFKVDKINKLLKSDPETYGGRDTVKDTTGLIKRRLMNQGYSEEVAQQMAEEQAAATGAPAAIDKLDKRNPNPITDYNPRNDPDLKYNIDPPGSPLDPVINPNVKDYMESLPPRERMDLEKDVGFEGDQPPSYAQNRSGLGEGLFSPEKHRPLNRRPGKTNIAKLIQNPFKD